MTDIPDESRSDNIDQYDQWQELMKQGSVALQVNNEPFIEDLKKQMDEINLSDEVKSFVIFMLKPHLSINALLSKHTEIKIYEKVYGKCGTGVTILNALVFNWRQFGLFVGFDKKTWEEQKKDKLLLSKEELEEDFGTIDYLVDIIIMPSLDNATSRTNTDDGVGIVPELIGKIIKEITHRVLNNDKESEKLQVQKSGLGLKR